VGHESQAVSLKPSVSLPAGQVMQPAAESAWSGLYVPGMQLCVHRGPSKECDHRQTMRPEGGCLAGCAHGRQLEKLYPITSITSAPLDVFMDVLHSKTTTPGTT
jgi:hypothetical protein